jgi:hypothetical protein
MVMDLKGVPDTKTDRPTDRRSQQQHQHQHQHHQLNSTLSDRGFSATKCARYCARSKEDENSLNTHNIERANVFACFNGQKLNYIAKICKVAAHFFIYG